ncbi:MAG: hypothetical protein IJZ82_03315 [Lachnospiraceae bacterium]|nr:hypothetical protein [Lachnospiraceae bacterium]
MQQESINWRRLMDFSLELVFAFDEQGRVNYMNQTAREMLEYSPEDHDVTVYDILSGTFTEGENGFVTNLTLGRDIQDLNVYRKNRTFFHAEARIFPSIHPGLYGCVVRDISKRDYLEKEIENAIADAQAAAKVKSEFVANVTHELRTPVNGILGNTRQLQELEEDRMKLKYLGTIERCCKDMNQIINNILDFSKLEAGKFTLDNQKFSFRGMVDYVKATHNVKATEKGLDFFVTVSSDIPEYVIGDELRIVQVLNNLLSNACKFTAIGKVALEVVKTAQIGKKIELFFMVVDSGIGISQEQMDKLFQSFSQVDASISRKYGGTGLGLNISKQLVELMGGKINVDSRPGIGSTFSFSVWVELTEEDLEEAQAAPEPMISTSGLFQQSLEQMMDTKKFGSADNAEALKKNLSKLILCVEMENWEKAESFMEGIRQLTEDAPREVKTSVLRLKMSVQKEDYDKTMDAYAALNELLQ